MAWLLQCPGRKTTGPSCESDHERALETTAGRVGYLFWLSGGCLRVSKTQCAKRLPVEIHEAQALALGDQRSRQRIVAKRRAAEMRHDAADVDDLVDLDPEQHELGAVGRGQLERHMGEA